MENNMAVNQSVVNEIRKGIQPATLIAATKYATVSDLEELQACGVKIFGENRVQAFLEKYEAFKGTAEWHMIGTLQCNKVKYIIDKVSLIHSVSSFSLIDEIQKQAAKHGLTMPILLQINIAHEESKHGFHETQAREALAYLAEHCPNIQPRGFMMMAPKTQEEETRVYFRAMKQLACEMQKEFPDFTLTELSMGMSNDYRTAVEEGSTMVRIGRKLFDIAI